MRITIEPTALTTQMDGIPVRYWEGTTDSGIPCKVFVHRIAVREDQDAEPFERELIQQLPPATHLPLASILYPQGRR